MSVSLSEHLPLLAEAPDGIKKLRGLILELAVRGKLVPQDPNDEPARELLKRIQIAKAKLIAEGRIKKDKPLPEVGEDEKPFVLPAGWTWARIGQIGHDWGQKTPDKTFAYIDVSAIDNKRGVIAEPTIVQPADAPSRARKLVAAGTVIYSTVRPYLLNIAVIARQFDPEPIASTAFAIVHPLGGISSQYLFWYLRSPAFTSYVESVQTGIAYPAINDGQFFGGLVPLPPLHEQHRIVAKVDELMALCDRMEAEQADAEAAHATLVQTLLGTLTQSRDAAELAANWQRLSQHVDTLFTTEASLDALKQAILQLAVMGKLVPQDPTDEAVKYLLARNDERRQEIAKCDRRADCLLQPILSESDRWEIPETWTWRGLADLVLFVDYRGKTPVKQSSGIRLLTAKNVRKGRVDLNPEEFLSEQDYKDWMTRGLPTAGDVLFTTEAPMGNAAVVELTEQFALAQRVICFQNYGALTPSFLAMQILSEQFQFILDKNGTGMTAKGIKASKLKQLPIAIPPLTEQHRIVAKVDELMALCDSLKADLAESRARQARLASTLIEAALQAA